MEKKHTADLKEFLSSVHFSSVAQSCPTLCDPRIAARQASPSITNSWSLLKLMSIESVMPSNHLILCRPLLLPPSIFPSIRIFSHESVLPIRWPKYWSFSFGISPSNEYWTVVNNSVQLQTKLYMVVVYIWKIHCMLKLHKNTLCFLWEERKFPQPYHSNVRIFIFPCIRIL